MATTWDYNNKSSGIAFSNIGYTGLVASFTPGAERNNYTANLGMTFTVGASPIVATTLGIHATSNSTGNWVVNLSNVAGTVLATATINLTGVVNGNFKYGSISSTTLAASTQYYLTAAMTNGGPNGNWSDSAPITLTGASSVTSCYSSTFTGWTNASANQCFVGLDINGAITVNATEAISASGTNPGVISTRVITGLTYGEIVATTLSSTYSIGFGSRSWSFSSGTLLGGDNNGIGYRSGGTVVLNNTTLSTIQTYAQGNVIQFAINPQLQQVWFNVNNGNWNNNSANSPVTGVGGISYATYAGGSLFVAFGAIVASNQAATEQFSSAAWTYSAPSGFSSIDATQATPIASEFTYKTPTSDGSAYASAVTTHAQVAVTHTAAHGWYGAGRFLPQWSPSATGKTISGVVQVSGAYMALTVRLINGLTGDFIAQTTSSAVNGTFSFTGLNPAITYNVIAFDPPTFQALVFDQVSGV